MKSPPFKKGDFGGLDESPSYFNSIERHAGNDDLMNKGLRLIVPGADIAPIHYQISLRTPARFGVPLRHAGPARKREHCKGQCGDAGPTGPAIDISAQSDAACPAQVISQNIKGVGATLACGDSAVERPDGCGVKGEKTGAHQ